jgi:hypothetical protein
MKASVSRPTPETCSIRKSVASLNFPRPSETTQLKLANHKLVPRATPATQPSLPRQSGVTHSREMKLAARIIQNTSTPKLPMTRTMPTMKAECGCNRSPRRSSILLAALPSRTGAVRTERAMTNFTPRKSMKTKLNSSIAAFT